MSRLSFHIVLCQFRHRISNPLFLCSCLSDHGMQLTKAPGQAEARRLSADMVGRLLHHVDEPWHATLNRSIFFNVLFLAFPAFLLFLCFLFFFFRFSCFVALLLRCCCSFFCFVVLLLCLFALPASLLFFLFFFCLVCFFCCCVLLPSLLF